MLVKIKNDTGGSLWLNLVGPETYNLNLPAGNSSIKVERGRYAYTITGCARKTITGFIRLGPQMGWRFTCEGYTNAHAIIIEYNALTTPALSPPQFGEGKGLG